MRIPTSVPKTAGGQILRFTIASQTMTEASVGDASVIVRGAMVKRKI
jgi:hypothetical protein